MMQRSPARRHLQRPALALLAVLAFLLGIPAAGAAEPASATSYAVLHRALEPALAIDAYPRLRALRRIESKLPGVPPSAIRLTIERASGPIELRPAADGTIDFPLDAALLAENPPVRSNQPRGSLVLSATLALATPPSRSLPPAFFTAALDDADRLLAADGSRARAAGIELHFAADAQATATLRGAAERTLVADHTGRIVLMRDRDLGGDTGSIELSATPTLVLPWLGDARARPGDDDD
jgi:hypothetical protein